MLGAYFFVETAQLERGFLNHPKRAEVQTGKVYPKQVKGGTVYLTEDEIKDFERKSEYFQAGLIIGCFAMGIGALVDSKS